MICRESDSIIKCFPKIFHSAKISSKVDFFSLYENIEMPCVLKLGLDLLHNPQQPGLMYCYEEPQSINHSSKPENADSEGGYLRFMAKKCRQGCSGDLAPHVVQVTGIETCL